MNQATGRTPWLALALGLALFGLGVTLAVHLLPSWQVAGLPPEERFVERFGELAAASGVTPTEEPRVWVQEGWLGAYLEPNPYLTLGDDAAHVLRAAGRPLLIHVAAPGHDGDGDEFQLGIAFGVDGRPWGLTFVPPFSDGLDEGDDDVWGELERLGRRLLLGADDTLGAPEMETAPSSQMIRWQAVSGPGPPRVLSSLVGPWGVRSVGLVLVGEAETGGAVTMQLAEELGRPLFAWLALAGMFGLALLVLALRRRVSMVHGAWLSGLLVAAGLVAFLVRDWPLLREMELLLLVPLVLLVLAGWSAGESWCLSAVDRRAAETLGLLLRGRPGPRVGRSLALGLGAGAGAGGLMLATRALVVGFRWGGDGSYAPETLGAGAVVLAAALVTVVACLVAVVWAFAWQVVDGAARWPIAVAATACAWGAVAPELSPDLLAVAGVAPAAVVLGWTLIHGGLLALWVAALVSALAPLCALALRLGGPVSVEAAVSGALLAALGLVAVVALRRPATVETAPPPPRWLQDADRRRDLDVRMGLLGSIQGALLPTEPPRHPDWEVAGRVLPAYEVGGDFYDWLEDDAGRLWVAVGDVAGHDSFCAIGHAMARAAIRSLVAADAEPAEVIDGLDRVLARSGRRRLFTALALARFDDTGGDGGDGGDGGRMVLANAGYPYPLVAGPPEPVVGRRMVDSRRIRRRRVEEVDLAGLPLGCRLPRTSDRQRELEVEPEGFVLFASDGLHEAVGRGGRRDRGGGRSRVYGHDRPRILLSGTGSGTAATAEAVVELLMADHRKFLGLAERRDDLTLVVVRRRGPRGADG